MSISRLRVKGNRNTVWLTPLINLTCLVVYFLFIMLPGSYNMHPSSEVKTPDNNWFKFVNETVCLKDKPALTSSSAISNLLHVWLIRDVNSCRGPLLIHFSETKHIPHVSDFRNGFCIIIYAIRSKREGISEVRVPSIGQRRNMITKCFLNLKNFLLWKIISQEKLLAKMNHLNANNGY